MNRPNLADPVVPLRPVPSLDTPLPHHQPLLSALPARSPPPTSDPSLVPLLR